MSFQMQMKVNKEYNALRELKTILDTFKFECSGDLPIGARRRDLPPDSGIIDLGIPDDPDVWPAPTPVDHGNVPRYILQRFNFKFSPTIFH